MNPTAVVNPDLLAQVVALNALLAQLVQFTSHVGTGAMSAHVIEWLKSRPVLLKIWNDFSARGKVIAGLVAAAIPAAGITLIFVHPTPDHPAQYGFLIDNFTWATGGKLAWSLAQNWVFQQGWYQSVIKPKVVAGLAPVAGVVAPPPVPVVVQQP